ncbi:hypothetical protein [Halocynthiibacter styelae]|uniref:Uncharacterized protein n=1 Tax=Halocynthiibacter styelae TaxID=2761955 RepID=A0A8J7IC30_9RHOB|nr:hypothetical protein [Paenihalocynthiibacter styelae]MBI1492224.1 hypothetical protein [Paenihalocynthiibacter styelae]
MSWIQHPHPVNRLMKVATHPMKTAIPGMMMTVHVIQLVSLTLLVCPTHSKS